MTLGDPVIQGKNTGGEYNVLAYGASSGGSAATNTAAIQSAIDAAEAAVGSDSDLGVCVYIPGGTYDINAGLTLQAGRISIVGDGKYATMIRQTGAADLLTINTSGAGRVGVRNLGLYFEGSGTRCAIKVDHGGGKINNGLLNNLYVDSFPIGIEITGSPQGGFWIISDCAFEGGEYGIYSNYGFGIFLVASSTFHAASTAAIYLRDTNCAAGSGCGDFTISGCNFDGGSSTFGVYVNNSTVCYAGNFNISGNKFDAFASGSGHPVYLVSCSAFKVLGNSYCGGALLADQAVTLSSCSNYVIDYEDRTNADPNVNEFGFAIQGAPPKIKLDRTSVGGWDIYIDPYDKLIFADSVSGKGIRITNAGAIEYVT